MRDLKEYALRVPQSYTVATTGHHGLYMNSEGRTCWQLLLAMCGRVVFRLQIVQSLYLPLTSLAVCLGLYRRCCRACTPSLVQHRFVDVPTNRTLTAACNSPIME
jgi:hypothetical protein